MAYETIPPSGGTNVSSTPLAAAATSISISGLDGNADGDYLIYFGIKSTAGTATGVLKFQYNDLDTNLYSFRSQQLATDAAPTITHSTTTCTFSAGPSVGDLVTGWIRCRTKTGYDYRTGEIACFVGNGPQAERTTFTYSDASTNIIKVRIIATNATSMDVGSFMTLQKLRMAQP